MGFILNRCDRCQGIWLKPAELRGIVRQAARGPVGAFLDRCFPKHEPNNKGSGLKTKRDVTQVE
jgi:Zn-finger nucleic acid-binding protein